MKAFSVVRAAVLVGALCFSSVAWAGSFVQETWSSTTSELGSVGWNFVGDFDGDGVQDLLSVNGTRLIVRRSTGTAFVQEVWSTTADKMGSVGFAWVGDFNGDGKADLATSVAGSELWVYLSTGTSFEKVRWSTTATHWGSTASWNFVGDFNGDGQTDILSSVGGSQLWVHRSTGTGFVDELWSSSVTKIGSVDWNWVADVDGDGKSDLISSVSGNSLYVQRSTGIKLDSQSPSTTGFVQELWSTQATHWGSTPRWNFIGDFDGDGRADVLSAASGGEVWVHRSRGSASAGGFAEERWMTGAIWGGEGWAWAADFNADGKTEIAVSSGATIYVMRFQQKADGSNGLVEETWCAGSCPNWAGSSPWNWIGDFTGDGRADIATNNGAYIWLKRAGP